MNEHIENGIEVSEDIYLNISKEEKEKDDFVSKNRKLVSPNGIKKPTNGCQKTK